MMIFAHSCVYVIIRRSLPRFPGSISRLRNLDRNVYAKLVQEKSLVRQSQGKR